MQKQKNLRLTHYQKVRIIEDFYHVDHKLLAEELNMPIATLKNYAYELRVQDHCELPVQYMKGEGGKFEVSEFKCWISGQRI